MCIFSRVVSVLVETGAVVVLTRNLTYFIYLIVVISIQRTV